MSLRAANLLSLSLGTVLAVACAQPPDEELALVGERIASARAAEAAVFAPELLDDAVSGLAEAEGLVRQSEHAAAIRAAAEASLAAEDAATEATAERALVVQRFERLRSELRALLEIAASRGADPEALHPLRDRCDHVDTVAEQGDLLGALGEAVALKPELLAFEQRFR
jgi:hypothetical protein